MKILFLPLFLLFCFSAKSQQPDSSSALFTMREAEWNFARQSLMYGRNAAFINNLAEHSVIYTDKWITNARLFWKERKAAPVVLKWEPEFMDISESQDFGVSTGPWESQEFRPGTKPTGTGYFLTVWKKEAGIWKVILDAGVSAPPKKNDIHGFHFPPGGDKPAINSTSVDTDALEKALMQADKKFSDEWSGNRSPETFMKFMAEGGRFQTEGHLPTTEKDSITNQANVLLAWVPQGAGAAASGDIVYTYGILIIAGKETATRGHYVKIWKRKEGRWLIEIEMNSF